MSQSNPSATAKPRHRGWRSIRQSRLAKRIGKGLKVLGPLEREPFRKVGEPQVWIELAKLPKSPAGPHCHVQHEHKWRRRC